MQSNIFFFCMMIVSHLRFYSFHFCYRCCYQNTLSPVEKRIKTEYESFYNCHMTGIWWYDLCQIISATFGSCVVHEQQRCITFDFLDFFLLACKLMPRRHGYIRMHAIGHLITITQRDDKHTVIAFFFWFSYCKNTAAKLSLFVWENYCFNKSKIICKLFDFFTEVTI